MELTYDDAGSGACVVLNLEAEDQFIEVTEVRVLPLAEVDRQHALDEGEGYSGTGDWRRGHEEFWHSPEYREAIGAPGFTVDDSTLVVTQRFRLIKDLRHERAG